MLLRVKRRGCGRGPRDAAVADSCSSLAWHSFGLAPVPDGAMGRWTRHAVIFTP